MKILFKQAITPRFGIRLYALVPSRTRKALLHRVVFIRKTGMRRWLCDCEDCLFRGFSRRRHCDHIKAVRETI